VSVYQAYQYSINDVFKTLSLVIASFPLRFRRFVPFKVVHFLPTCISPYFIIMYAAYSVYKKFLMLPFSSLFIRQGESLNFGVFCAIFGAFFLPAFRLISLMFMLLIQFLKKF